MKRSKLLSVLLAALIAISSFSCLSVVSFAAIEDSGNEYDDEGNITKTYWELDDSGTLTIYSDSAPTWVDHEKEIKKVVLEAGVTTIPEKAFYNCVNLTSFDASKAILDLVKIEAYAFANCTSLVDVVLTRFVNTIGEYAFYGCTSLKTIDIGSSLAVAGDNIFKDCAALETVNMGIGIKVIGYGMFENCVSLVNIILPDSVENIGGHAFESCTSLKEANIPDSVKEVGGYAYYECTAITSAVLGHNLAKVGEYIFGRCTSLETVTFRTDEDIICDWMFYGCTSLKTIVDFPESAKKIGNHAFEGCATITEITLPNTVEEIGAYAFADCTGLTEILLPKSLLTIGEYAFKGASFNEIDIPYGVSNIGKGAFTACASLSAINVSDINTAYRSIDGILYSEDGTVLIFCPAAKSGDVVIPETVVEIAEGAFVGCTALGVIEIPASVTIIDAIAFNGCADTLVIKTPCNSAAAAYAKARAIKTDLIHSEKTEWVVTNEPGCESTGEKELRCVDCGHVLQVEGIDAIGHNYNDGVVTKNATCDAEGVVTYTCQNTGCSDTYTVNIPALGHKYTSEVIKEPTCDEDGVRRYTCQNDGCHSVYTEAIPATDHALDDGTVTLAATCDTNGVKTYKCTHANCNYKTTEVIPATGHKMDKGTVTKEPTCTELGVLTFRCQNAGCEHETTSDIPALGHSYDDGVITKNPTVNENGVITYTCETCKDTYEVSIPNTAFDGITATNEGAYADENGEIQNLVWALFDDGTLVIYADTELNEWASYGAQVKTVIITGTTTVVNNSAFAGYPALEKVVFTKTLARIEAGAFSECQGLTQLVIPGTTAIEDYAFYNCDNLTDVVICGGLAQGKVGKNIFKSCDALKTVEVLNGAIEIGEGMFDDCMALESLLLPDSICEIGRLAFENCIALKNIIIPDSTVELGDYAFYGCVSAETAYIGHNLAKVGEYAFGECTSLKDVEIKCAMPAISDGMFFGCTSLAGLAKLPAGVKTIGKNAFAGCTSFSEITIPDTVISIGDSAFDGTALETISIPASVDAIGKGAFTNCAALTAINVDNKNDNYFSVDGVLYEMSLATLELCPAGKSGEVTVWEGTKEIAVDAFIGCNKVTKINVPASVTKIADNAFNGCATTLVIKADCDSYAIQFAKGRGIATELVHVGEDAWQITLEPTCLADGAKERVCSACGYSYEIVAIDAIGHSYDNGVITTKATCEAEGVVTFTCVNDGCDDSYTESIPALQHNYNNGTVIVSATCEADGTRRFECQNDGCYDYYDVAIPAIGHNLDNGTVVTPVTCEADGEVVHKCTNTGCEYIETVVIPATGHNYKSEVVKPATCIDDGKIKYTCENCDNSYTEGFAGEHKPYSEPQRTEPTCDTDGKEGEFCSICHQYIGAITVIPATGHSYEDGKCTECGKSDGSVKPATPKLVKVGNTIHGPVIYWNDVDKADYYKIYALVDGKWTFVAIVNADEQNKYVDTKAVSGKTYTYSVSAVNGTLEGAYNKDGLTILFLDDPALKSIANTRTGVKVTWGKIKGATSYNVYRRTASSGWTLIKNVKTTSYVDTTAKSGTAYIYTVRARNGSTLSSYYANGINILFLGTPDVESAAAATNGVTVKWAKVSGAKVYRVYRKTGNGDWELLAKVSGSASSFKDKTAKSGKVYTYTVRAQNGSTKGAYETEGVKIKFLATPKLTSAKASSKGVTVKFGAVSGASGYRVYRKTANGSWVLLATTKSTSYTDKTAKKGVTYTYTVRAVSGSYKGAYNTKGISCKAK